MKKKLIIATILIIAIVGLYLANEYGEKKRKEKKNEEDAADLLATLNLLNSQELDSTTFDDGVNSVDDQTRSIIDPAGTTFPYHVNKNYDAIPLYRASMKEFIEKNKDLFWWSKYNKLLGGINTSIQREGTSTKYDLALHTVNKVMFAPQQGQYITEANGIDISDQNMLNLVQIGGQMWHDVVYNDSMSMVQSRNLKNT